MKDKNHSANTVSVFKRILTNCAAQAKEYGSCVAAKVPEVERDIVLPSGTNPGATVGGNATVRTLHGLDSITTATVSNNVMPIGDISNHATNIPSSAFGGNSKNISNNTTTTNNVPSGGGTKNNSNNLTRHRVTFQSNLQPANRANAQVPGNQNQAQEGTGLTKSQKRTLAKKRRREKGKDPIIDAGLGIFSVPQLGEDGVRTLEFPPPPLADGGGETFRSPEKGKALETDVISPNSQESSMNREWMMDSCLFPEIGRDNGMTAPSYCLHCMRFGHSDTVCRRRGLGEDNLEKVFEEGGPAVGGGAVAEDAVEADGGGNPAVVFDRKQGGGVGDGPGQIDGQVIGGEGVGPIPELGVYSKQKNENLKSVVERMLCDCVERCIMNDMMNICLEADSWDGIEVDVDRWAPHGLIRTFKCAERVNVVAACLVELCVGANVSIRRREGLPKGLGRILALEGIPHFVFGPGADVI
nr:peptide upstream ORF protein [Ipomoea batatas]